MVAIVGVVSMVYGAFAAMAQKDFKRLVAYSSVSHMGYVLLGIGVCSATAGNLYNSDAWRMGVSGAMFQMIAHGISSAGMFFLVGVVYDRVHHRDLDRFGGLFQHMPTYAGISMVIFFAALGLPGLCGFIGEVFVVLSVWRFSMVLAVIAAAVVILTAGYILWTIQRVYLGPEYKGPHAEALRPMTLREIAIAAPLVVMAVLLGVFPNALLKYTDYTIKGFVDHLNPARQSAQFLPPGEPNGHAQSSVGNALRGDPSQFIAPAVPIFCRERPPWRSQSVHAPGGPFQSSVGNALRGDPGSDKCLAQNATEGVLYSRVTALTGTRNRKQARRSRPLR